MAAGLNVMEITQTHYIVLSVLLFCIGAVGVLVRRNAIVIFLCVEIMLNAVNIALVAFSRGLDQNRGEVFVFFVIAVAAAESAIGLSLLILLYRQKRTLDVDEINSLKG
ncbi:MAG: NADH-quinone oxidoreductase subunit NuoK [Spirochaetia bacterium]|nr:NADH-quinone oxidoreductase subunit NuoK [Spirochaetia bacterium]